MRIAMIGQKGMPAIFGGVERHVHELSMRLVKRGHEVTVYSRPWYGKSKVKAIEGVNIKCLSSLHTKHLDTITHALLATASAIINKNDIIHYHGVGPALLAWIPRIFAPQAKVVVTFHSIDRKHEKWNWFARLILKIGEWAACRFPHETVAVSRTIEQYVRDVYDKSAAMVPNGVPAYQKSARTDELKKWGLAPRSYILLVSRLIPHKGAHYAVEAYLKLKKNLPTLVENLPMVIVGDGYYTEKYVKRLKKLSAQTPRIIFTGTQSGEALKQLYSHARLMIHPSDNEGLPITVLEGMSYTLPVLVSDIVEHRELVDNPDYLFIRSQPASLAEKLANLLKKNPAELELDGLNNARYVKRAYSWETATDRLIDIYYRIRRNEKAEKLAQAI